VTGFTALMPLWALLGAVAAYLAPAPFVAMDGLIVPLLGLVMLGMGMTLTARDFTAVLRRPEVVGLGIGLQYLVMPLAGWAIGLALGLPPALLAGLVLVGASPGGTASNVVCYLARGDVALSITLTIGSTLIAILATPFLTWLYVGERVPVPVEGMLWSIARIVLVPVAVGVMINSLLGAYLGPLKRVFPAVSVAAIVLIIAIIVGLNQANVATLVWAAALAVVLHNALGLAAGYWVARRLGWDERTARTLAIEVGMQNSGLAVALAVKHFSAAAALPGALFSVWHNLSGSLLAGHWARRPPPESGSRNCETREDPDQT
jgi:BASS family bile acid:Na+ symporter